MARRNRRNRDERNDFTQFDDPSTRRRKANRLQRFRRGAEFDFGSVPGTLRERTLVSRKRAYGSNYEDRVPWKTDRVQRNATFEARSDRSQWRYFRPPRGIQVDMTGDPDQAIRNQAPLIYMVRDLANRLDSQDISSTSKAEKRAFHIQMTRTHTERGVPVSPGSTPGQAAYLQACNEERPSPFWVLNFGLRLTPTSANAHLYSMGEVISSAAKDVAKRSENTETEYQRRFAEDSMDMESLVRRHGFDSIDLTKDKSAYHTLTSWMNDDGVYTEDWGFLYPLYGTSVGTQRYGEITFYVCTKDDQRRKSGEYYDPRQFNAKWAREIFRPENNVVHLSARGDILSMKHTRELVASMEDAEYEKERERSGGDIRLSQIREMDAKQRQLAIADLAAKQNPIIENYVMMLAVESIPGEEPPIISALRSEHDFTCTAIVGNQDEAMHFTVPGFNKPVFTNGKRTFFSQKSKRASSRIFPGALFMSGLFNSSIPPNKNGIFVGTSNSFMEFKPYFIDPAGPRTATAGENSPGVLATGRPGAGKAQPVETLLMAADGQLVPLADIQPGDELLDMNGARTTVLAKTPEVEHRLLHLELSDGREKASDLDHLWPVESARFVRGVHALRAKIEEHRGLCANGREAVNLLLDLGKRNGLWTCEQHLWHSLTINLMEQSVSAGPSVEELEQTPAAVILDMAQQRLETMLAPEFPSPHMAKVAAIELYYLTQADAWGDEEFSIPALADWNVVDTDLFGDDVYDIANRLIDGELEVGEVLFGCTRRTLEALADYLIGQGAASVISDAFRTEHYTMLLRAAGCCLDAYLEPVERTYVRLVSDRDEELHRVCCLTVDSKTTTYLLDDLTPTGNTTLLENMAKQTGESNEYCAYFNFKSTDSISSWWMKAMPKGVVVTIDPKTLELESNRGYLDPFNFYDRSADMARIASTISDAVQLLWERNRVNALYEVVEASIGSAISDRVRNPRVRCTGDVIFGTGTQEQKRQLLELEDDLRRKAVDETTMVEEMNRQAERLGIVAPLPYRELRKVIMDAINGSQFPFWKAFVSLDGRGGGEIRDAIRSGRPILFEWGQDFTPQASKDGSINTVEPSEFDAALSSLVCLKYTIRSALRAAKATGQGGVIYLDESAGVMRIPRFRAEMERALREFRDTGILLVFSSQFLSDWRDMLHLFSIFIIGAISRSQSAVASGRHDDDSDLSLYLRLSNQLDNEDGGKYFITNAGRTKESGEGEIANRQAVENPVPYAWVVDHINNVNSPIILGSYPLNVLTAGKSDEEREKMRRELLDSDWDQRKKRLLEAAGTIDKQFG